MMDLSELFVGRKLVSVLEKAVWSAGFHVTRKVNTLRWKRNEVIRRSGVSTVLDVGANTGQWAMELLRDGFTGRIVSFEPHPAAYAQLTEIAPQFNMTCLNVGLGAEDGYAEFFLTKARSTAVF